MTTPALHVGVRFAPRPARLTVPVPRQAPQGPAATARRQSSAEPAATGAPRAPFLVCVGVVLVAGLLGTLLLNTVLAQGSFTVRTLQRSTSSLAVERQRLEQSVALADSPAALAARARALGLVQARDPAFLRLSDGALLGAPRAGTAAAPSVKAAARTKPAGAPAARRAATRTSAQHPGHVATGTGQGAGARRHDPHSRAAAPGAVTRPGPGSRGGAHVSTRRPHPRPGAAPARPSAPARPHRATGQPASGRR